MLEANNVDVVYAPPNCTDSLWPLDLAKCQQTMKDFLKQKYELWYLQQMFEQGDLTSIKHSKKPLKGQWILNA